LPVIFAAFPQRQTQVTPTIKIKKVKVVGTVHKSFTIQSHSCAIFLASAQTGMMSHSPIDRDVFTVHCRAGINSGNMAEKAIPYVRDREANKDAPYEIKFATFIKAVADAQATGCNIILIVEPWVIGDTYEEITESLARLSGTGIGLQIVTAPKTPWNN